MKLGTVTMLMIITGAVAMANTSVGDTIIVKYTDDKNLKPVYKEKEDPEIHCLALNIYHEARSDNLAGQAAVADVVLNRVADKRYPNSICKVIKQGPISKWWLKEKGKEVPIRNRCQFSWWCDGKSDEPKQTLAWRKAQEIAFHIVNNDLFRGITEGATHYHATYVDPHWNKSMLEVGRIGEHIFYKSLPK